VGERGRIKWNRSGKRLDPDLGVQAARRLPYVV